jgi:ubiquinone/menaquinone biosynthesis C-methylase UbiE
MGFFSLPMAKMTGETGKVYAVDLQKKMLEKLTKRADKKGLIDIIDTRLADESSLNLKDLSGTLEFVLGFAALHEISNPKQAVKQIYNAMKKGGMFLIAEPKGHVKRKDFNEVVNIALETGFKLSDMPKIKRMYSVLLTKTG